MLPDPMKRDSAFISGAVKCLARTPGGLPHEIATWLCQEGVPSSSTENMGVGAIVSLTVKQQLANLVNPSLMLTLLS